jgi:hypothetical protein
MDLMRYVTLLGQNDLKTDLVMMLFWVVVIVIIFLLVTGRI